MLQCSSARQSYKYKDMLSSLRGLDASAGEHEYHFKEQIVKPTTEDQRRTAKDSRGDRVIEAMRSAPKPTLGMSTAQLMEFTRAERATDPPADLPSAPRPTGR